MIYFANPTEIGRPALMAGLVGFIATPRQGQHPPHGVKWCLDNNCFGKSNFNELKWWKWLELHADIPTCYFASAPDVVGDAEATLKRSAPWLPRIRELGYPAAYVAQDGIKATRIPWDEFDCLFIGGTNDFKLGPEGRAVAQAAKAAGKWLHVGRVNSYRRYRYAEAIGADSVDGTHVTFGPNKRFPELLLWRSRLLNEPALFGLQA